MARNRATKSRAILLTALVACGPWAPALATCPTASTSSDVDAHVARGEVAFEVLDVEAFGIALDEASLVLPCLSEPIDPTIAARYHRALGIRLFTVRDAERARLAFAAARTVQPGYELPDTLVPEGHQIRREYEAIDVTTGVFEDVHPPAEGLLYFDGRAGLQRPTDWSTIVQVASVDGTISSTAYLFPGEPMPAYAVATVPEPRAGLSSTQKTFLVVSATAGVSALGLWGGAEAARVRFENPDNGLDEQGLISLRERTNALVIASAVSGGIAVIGGAGFVLAGTW